MTVSAEDDQDLLDHATRSIVTGSKSFAAASRLFDPVTRRSAVMLYAWCRHCDDVIDGQEAGHSATVVGQQEAYRRLESLVAQTRDVYAGRPVKNDAFAAFRDVMISHRIRETYALEHLSGFAMDVQQRQYHHIEDTLDYCYHVAGVVGLMMAQVMGVSDELTLDRACDLGMGFQLTNIARDIIEDAGVGRCYLPRDWLNEFSIPEEHLAQLQYRDALAVLAARLVDMAEPFYASAQAGLSALPWRSAWAVGTASGVYREIGIRVKKRGAHAWDTRVSTSKLDKVGQVLAGLCSAVTSRGRQWPERDAGLWQRPRHVYSMDHRAVRAVVPEASK
ncbi:phytoene synthase [Pseudomonas syringae]|uniref:Phytoene synthase n=1 Tax=Pseudomonas syringae TaxID=317 RepID=A0AB37ZUS7_PSESX|nr:phytoene/squalene synthase family protein [Pseudomonas syringae]MBI6669649.1 phytoene/squalene synthase family protein [Pseudomonas syringae]MBI6679660.1 phytoene/squalene synthase family protein [Pseudomonas syringae]MBI6839638.1 phytoene/squalene synthase family protein [Pseudomonas syringae]NAP22211.1 phytoene/squalene synthase family protein [Pseudomonas syringae]NAQ17820.1 phytoene/squalene synthase family protein [Pseudomonas syringae]